MKKIEGITQCEQEILNCVKKFINEKGYSPSVRDIAKVSGRRSPATIQTFLNHLKTKGYVTWEPKQNRTLRVVEREGE